MTRNEMPNFNEINETQKLMKYALIYLDKI